jgi:hypothetical protein
MSLYTVIRPTTRLNDIFKAVAETELHPVNDEETLYQFNVSENTCQEIVADILQQVSNNVVCYYFTTNVCSLERRDQGYSYVGKARNPQEKTNNISFTWSRFHQTRADSNYRFC